MLQSIRSKRSTVALAVALITWMPACDGDEGDEGADEHGDHEHEDHGDHGGEGADPDTMVAWITAPSAMVAAGEPVGGDFHVHTMGELHVTEVRACSGADVAMCGLGDMDSFESSPAQEADEHGYEGALTLDAGEWTVVAYAHVGPDPFVSEPVNVTVSE